MSYKIRKVKLTPELAAKWLETMPEYQRQAAKYTVDTYATDMMDNRWVEGTGDFIRFNTKGQMIDGQHRCLAVIRSGVTINVDVLEGLSDKVYFVLDKGKKRTVADTVGGKNSNARAAVAKTMILLGEGIPLRSILVNYGSKSVSSIATPVHTQEVMMFKAADIDRIMEGYVSLKIAGNGKVSAYVATCLASYAIEKTGSIDTFIAFCADMAKNVPERPDICTMVRDRLIGYKSSKERSKNVPVFSIYKVGFDNWLTSPDVRINKLAWGQVSNNLNNIPLKRDWIIEHEGEVA